MGKVKCRWIELDYTVPGALKAECIPYDAVYSVKEAIDNFVYAGIGATGSQGSTGFQGSQGYTGVGPAGVTGLALGSTGLQGPVGLEGQTGIQGIQGQTGVQGIQGETGFVGETGIQGLGLTGLQGIQGETGFVGETGIQGLGVTGIGGSQGLTGVRGVTGIQGLGLTGLQGIQGQTGLKGSTGIQALGFTGIQGFQGQTGILGPQGVTGVSGPSAFKFNFNTVSRYQDVSTAGEEVWVVSSSTVYGNLSWGRIGTVITITRANHGHSIGDRIILRNTNLEYQSVIITAITTNTFQVATSNTGSIMGSEGAYSLGFIYQHVGSPNTGGQLLAPTGDHADVQLVSIRIRTGSRNGTTYDLEVPASSINGAGDDTGLDNCFMPDFSVRFDADNLSAVAATMTTNISGSYSIFRFGNLGTASLSRFIIAHF